MPKAKSKKAADVLSPDIHRDRILRHLYQRHSSARGPAKIPIGIRDLQRELKAEHGMTQQEVSANLDYLVQVGWAREVIKERSFTTEGGMELSQEQVRYKISDHGINHLQSGTIFKKPDAASHVNITNIKGVTVVGDGNVVNSQFTDLSRALDQLDKAIGESGSLSDEQKLNAAGDVSTIRAQIAKHTPTIDIIKAAWRSLEGAATLAGAADAFQKVKDIVVPLIAG